MSNKTTTSVNVLMDRECNRLLNESSKQNSRTKRHEAAARLKDHLLRFGEGWSEKQKN